MLLLLALTFLGGAAFLIGEIATAPARARQTAVHRAATYGKVKLRAGAEVPKFHVRVVQPLAQRTARLVLRFSPKSTVDSVSLKLLAAGMSKSPTSFLAVKGTAVAAGFFFGLLFGGAASGIGGSLLFAPGLAALGFFLPEFIVGSRARKRREKIAGALPDALDLLAVSVEAGLGFDGAVTKLTEHMEGPLIDEFALT